MKEYDILFSLEAQADLMDYVRYIRDIYFDPITALNHYLQIMKKINSLKYMAESIELEKSKSFRKFGWNVRRINYKKMSIVYTVHGDIVYIHTIMPQENITGT